MKICNSIFVVPLLFIVSPLFSQQLFTTTEVKSAMQKGTRTPNGEPGKNYWQNKGDYTIHVNFDPASNLLSGNEVITYYNNSPDTLRELIIRLYPDLYKKGVTRLSEIDEKDLNEGVSIDSFQIGNETINNFSDPGKAFHKNTNLIIHPGEYILPHSTVKLSVRWHYTLNTGSPVRTGMVDSGSYFIAYFFPRVSVYDDIDDWDTWSYNGTQEFYNDFGNFNVDISVPKDYVVWATGDRLNAPENFSDKIIKKMKIAATSTKIIHVIDETDYSKHDIFSPTATGTWKFSAKDVTDFAFAISNHYLWDVSSVVVDSSTGRRTLAEAAYNKIHLDYFDVANQAHQSVFYMSHFYPKYPFPFNHETVFDGTDQMEYPMMVNDNPTQSHKDAVQLTSHEIFHSYFPFFMGINETQYAWMDEGWATIGESVISPLMGEPEDEGIFSKKRYEAISGTDKDVPLITNTKLYSDAAYLSNSYGKGGLCYYVLQDLLGDKLYFKSLHQYMNDWNGKHPVPYDFFYSFNNASGRNLNWFWQKWFFEWAYPDLSIKNVEKSGAGSKITIENKGGLPLPVYLTITYSGKIIVIKYTAVVWKDGKTVMSLQTKLPFSVIDKVKLGNEFIPDKFEKNNTWIKNK
ncbi:M1 family metallopeptidase [Ginsengibacter hankyongi]|uniref:M1 family metallopeptidase n=1 Tax=Ginsengibacter hankyongi TaxID=2607284 RepID=A0A5J5IHE6_9BACT|nr:M1 family metallopeptidase [Ginsengibacter hankyongi]KAA9038500.1 M1 family metallopeptidase [Ginsengibacter hankyongi]